MSKIIKYGGEAQEKIKAGLDQVANAVKVTIGPRGRNVVLDRGFGSPVITNDGVSIAKEIDLSDKFENIGAELIREVASKTNDVAGDGTTTATILAQAIATEGMKLVATGMNPIMIRKGIEDAKEEIIKNLRDNSKVISSQEEIEQVASISAESQEMGKMIASVIKEIGKDGVITVEESQTFGFSKEVVDGMSFDKGYISPYMITDGENLKSELKDPFIIITDKKISILAEILPLLEKITAAGKKDIVIIADDVDGEALTTLVVNKLRGSLNVLAIKAPEFGDSKKSILEDLAILTGGKVISEEKGMKLENADLNVLGKSGKVIATKDSTTIVGGKGKKKDIEERISQLKNQIESSENRWDKEKIQKRLAKLSGGVAVIRVGAATETELNYLKHKMEDALSATRAAIAEGIVAGGGVALVKAADAVLGRMKAMNSDLEEASQKEARNGFMALINACVEPFKQIIKNTGLTKEDVALHEIMKKKSKNCGYDANKNKPVDDMIKAGIIDPLKVTRTALENAVSVASILLTTEAAVADKPEEKCSCSDRDHSAPMM